MIAASIIGAAAWLFLAGDPSPVAWILALLLLSYAVLGYVYLSLTVETISPDAADHFGFEQLPETAPRLEAAPASVDLKHELAKEIQHAAKAWGVDKKGR